MSTNQPTAAARAIEDFQICWAARFQTIWSMTGQDLRDMGFICYAWHLLLDPPNSGFWQDCADELMNMSYEAKRGADLL